MIDQARFAAGDSFAEFLAKPLTSKSFWEAVYKRAAVPDDVIARARALGGRWHLLVLNEDWCGDSVNILPYLAKLTESADNLEMRLVRRDDNLDIMDAHLTGKSRSIPVVILLDKDFNECGWWGPRPAELQRWVLEEGMKLPKEERYKQARTWYARDRGVTTMHEIITTFERCAAPRIGGGIDG
jgi:hypothetical protein